MNTLSALPVSVLRQYLAELTPEQRRALGLSRPATDAEVAGYEQAHAPGGAPADFAGPVFSNPDQARVSEDTESGIDPLRLPTGVTLQHQNFSGAMPTDLSNPVQAQIVGPHMQTVGASSQAQGDWFEQNAPKSTAAASGDWFEQNAPKKEAEPPADYLSRMKDRIHESAATLGRETGSLAETLGTVINPMTYYHAAADEPTPTELKLLGAEKSSGPVRVANFIQRLTGMGQIAEAARFYRTYLQASPDKKREMETEILDVAPEAVGTGGAAILAPKLLEKAPSVINAMLETAKKAPAAIAERAAAVVDKARNVTPKQAAQAVGGTSGAISGHGTLSAPGAYYGAKTAGRAAEIVLGKERANRPLFPKKSAPAEAPPVEDLEGITSRQTAEAGAGEAEVSTGNAPETVPAETPVEPASSAPRGAGVPRTLSGESALTQILTGQDNANLLKIARSRGINVTQEAQLKPGVADTRLIRKIIDDHTPEELGELRDTYLEHTRFRHNFGDIGPEAWKTLSLQTYFPDIKLPAAVLKRTQSAIEMAGKPPAEVMNAPASEAAAPKAPKIEAAPKAKTPAIAKDDLTDLLAQSVEQAKGIKGGVFTSADPAELMQRWGVDPESLTSGREQTRGMSPAETEAAVDKLAKAYKKGQAIEPILETRDAQNNVIDVDGRMRVIAAHRAGIKRIPVIVRRA